VDALFPSSNPWGVPDLDAGLCPTAVPLPVWAWGSVARDREHSGTWHFYVDDKRFQAIPGDRVEVYFKGDRLPCTPETLNGAGEVVYQVPGYTCVKFDGETTQHEWPTGWVWLA
jgi:N-acetylmuramoyl-L-alanine amidase CwlA